MNSKTFSKILDFLTIVFIVYSLFVSAAKAGPIFEWITWGVLLTYFLYLNSKE